MNSPNASDHQLTVPRRTRVLCVDDHHGTGWVLRLLIDAEADMQCVGCIESCNHLIEDVRALGAEVVLLDATMRGKDPIEAMRELALELPRVKTIIFSGHDDQPFIDRVMNAGARGFISKNDGPESILRTVREVVTQV